MRCLLTAIMMCFLAAPAFASDTICRIDGPHNCKEQIDDRLDAITRNTIHALNLAHPGHTFRTENDVILEQAASRQAALSPALGQTAQVYPRITY